MTKWETFSSEENVWLPYDSAPIIVKDIIDNMEASLEAVQETVACGKHYYLACKYEEFTILVAYDDITAKPTKYNINPRPIQ